MTDALSEISREETRARIINESLWELANQMWHYAKKYPAGELREKFVTGMLENIREALVKRIETME